MGKVVFSMKKVLTDLENQITQSESSLETVFKTWAKSEMAETSLVRHWDMVEEGKYLGIFPEEKIAVKKVSFFRFGNTNRFGIPSLIFSGSTIPQEEENWNPEFSISAWGHAMGENRRILKGYTTRTFYIVDCQDLGKGKGFKSVFRMLQEEREARMLAQAEERKRVMDEKGRENLGKELWDQLEERSKEDLWKAWAKAKIEPVS